MKTDITQEEGVIVIHMKGCVHFEAQLAFREHLTQIQNHSSKKVIFDFKDLEFIGSSNISSFVQILKEFNQNCSQKPKYCFVQNEFQKLIKAFDQASEFEFYESLENAKKSFLYSQTPSKCS